MPQPDQMPTAGEQQRAEAELAVQEAGDSALPVAWAREDLLRAVREALAAEGHLLSAGERVVAQRLFVLEPAAAALYARLWGRRGELFRLEGLRYAEVPDTGRAAASLVEAELASRGEAVLPARRLADALTVEELQAACRALGWPARGRRAELLDRLSDEAARPALIRPTLLIRHGGLFRRLARVFLGSRHGDLSRLVLERLELTRYATYTPTGGAGFFSDRRALRAWEEGLARDGVLDLLPAAARGEALLAGLAADLGLVEGAPVPEPWRARFSARRLAERRAAQAARHLERIGRPADAAAVYARMLAAGAAPRGELLLRQAMSLEAQGLGAQGARLCADALRPAASPPLPPADALALARTGRRLARASRVGWAPLPPLTSPRARKLLLPLAPGGGSRPLWAAPSGPRPLEAALVDLLAHLGRRALHAEGLLWRTLFGLLFAEVLFAPVAGMLPTPLRAGPLDLGGPGFVERRAGLIARLLAALRAGEAPDRLAEAWRARQGELIAGVAWTRFSLADLQAVARDLGGPALASVLEVVALDWSAAPRGLPDLVILAGPAACLPHALPARLPAGALLAEVKGPGDSLRDAQRVWLDRLVQGGAPAELWWVEAAPEPAASAWGAGG